MGNRLRSSPQKPIVEAAPPCRKVTNVTCTVVPLSPMIAVSCTTLTKPLTLEVPLTIAPLMKMFPHPALTRTRQTVRRADRRHFKGHPPGRMRKVYT